MHNLKSVVGNWYNIKVVFEKVQVARKVCESIHKAKFVFGNVKNMYITGK